MKKTTWWIATALTLFTLAPAAAQRPQGRPAGEPMQKDDSREAARFEPPKPEEKIVTTEHRTTIDGKEIRYTATTGTLLLKEEDGKPKASIFFIAYTRDGIQDKSRRPVTFTYNGGPGSSSVWLHMGAFGPRRVEMGEDGFTAAPPYPLVDNESSLLDVTDLVFIDPVTTGFSRAVPGEDPKQFYGLEEDAQAVGEFIRLWTTRFARWQSPKFLAGESYGTTRSAALSRLLQDRHGMYLNGIVLISSILNFQTARFSVGNDMPYPLFLPTYTATAWYHKKLPQDLQAAGVEKAVDEARRFALGEYTLALAQGNDLSPQQWDDIAAKVSRLTGLSADYVKRTNLRPEIQAFVKELLRDQRQTVGRLDSRFKGMDRDAAGQEYEFDPSYAAIQGPYTAVFNDYVSQDLGYKSDIPYEILSGRVRPWNWGGEGDQGFVNVAENLRQAMSQNPALKVFVGNGYYDLATPFFATEYTFNHLGFEPGYEQRVTKKYYQAGHMMYVRRADREQLKRDVAAFITAASGG
jgi:carboxypeptidase C (cathepsin A)